MNYYKPRTIEENLSNITWMKDRIYMFIESYINQYQSISLYYYNNAINMNIISYQTTYEIEIAKLSYSIFAFSNDIYHRISYGLDCWNRIRLKNDNGASVKNYDKTLNIMNNKKIITDEEKFTLLKFRKERNFATHYGKLVFIKYVFDNSQILYNLLDTIENVLKYEGNINYSLYYDYFKKQTIYIKDLENTLSEFSISNKLAV